MVNHQDHGYWNDETSSRPSHTIMVCGACNTALKLTFLESKQIPIAYCPRCRWKESINTLGRNDGSS